MPTIALADDQALVRSGLRALLEKLGGVDILIEAEDGDALLAALRRRPVDVVVSDIRMPRRSGIEVTRLLREQGDVTPVLLLTTFDDPGLLRAAAAAGAQGFLLKDASPETLKAAIQRLARGDTLFEPVALPGAGEAPAGTGPTGARLSPREVSILRLVAGGYSNKEIARSLLISDGTVKNHITDILQKLDARDRTHAVLKAIGARWL
ncbi:DNA-binding response regulator [Solimonas sp. K1W22B-7]|uniref:response regulator transcription factor n=1 Tax=Solimonas sp. K1W22B-7 TaxID=2303331 RepID=UPI000E330A93|nr:response regulator transcription factor [Solimonas sp. K1W22B-7]AXQ27244.1 DNA-binding response regulator [Solimonas sp. K1W22B-7]